MNSLQDDGFLIASAVTMGFAALHVYGERVDSQRVKWLSKPFASIGFIAAAIAVDAHTHPFGIWVLVGLVLSTVGDILLIPRSTGPAFLAGLGAFLLAHVAYCGGFIARGVDTTWLVVAAAPTIAFGIGVHRWLKPDVDAFLQRPIVAYIAVICAMVAASFGTFGAYGGLLLPIAAVMFLLSDVSVAIDRFKGGGFGNRLWGAPLYFAAQLVFAAAAAPH